MTAERWPVRRRALVTGGTDGVGKEVARGLARGGCAVVIVGRDVDKGRRAEEELRESAGHAEVRFLPGDLSLVRGAIEVADELVRSGTTLRFLVHSAGIVRGRYELTADGIESNFAVNYLSRFVLTTRLLPLLQAAGRPGAAARILIVGGAAQNGTIYFENTNLRRRFSTLRAVGQFCAANDVFTLELARRLAVERPESPVTIANLKLGVVKTNIRREFPIWMKWLVPLIMDPLLGQTPVQAAAPALELLLDRTREGTTGALFLKVRQFKQVTANGRMVDPELGRRLWALSERLVQGAQ